MFYFPLFSCQGGDGGPQGCRNMIFEEQNPLGVAHDRGGTCHQPALEISGCGSCRKQCLSHMSLWQSGCICQTNDDAGSSCGYQHGLALYLGFLFSVRDLSLSSSPTPPLSSSFSPGHYKETSVQQKKNNKSFQDKSL